MTGTPSGYSGRRRQGGFTLLELLIAVSLLGLIFAALAGGLRFGVQAWRVGADRLAEGEDLQLIHRVLRRQFAAALNAPGLAASAQEPGSFEGRRDRASFVGTAPARSMVPGLFQLSVGLKPDGSDQTLSLSWHRIGQESAESGRDDIEPLLGGIRNIRFRYFGNPGEAAAPYWSDTWSNTAILPRLVRIEIEFADSRRLPWPPIVLTVGATTG